MQDRGLAADKIADEVGVERATVEAWITEDASPTTPEFRRLTKILDRPESFFFLPTPPSSAPVRAQFRSYAGSHAQPGTETASGIVMAQRVQRIMAWIRGLTAEKAALPDIALSDEVEASAERLRAWLGWSVKNQVGKENTDTSAAKAFRAALQSRNIIVLHLTLDEDKTRGFSLHHPSAPVIAINTRDVVRARLFSYAHELVHLCLGEDSVCRTSANRGIEAFCNKVAAALLMPAAEFRAYARRRFDGEKIATTAQVGSMRNRFRVSLRAAAIRAETLDLATAGLFERVDREAEYKGGGAYQEGQERTKPRIRVDQYGSAFVSSLADAEDRGLLPHAQVLDLLRLSDAELKTARELAAAGADS
jgi:Zn-dependent peptidase ImmA (M78 family)